MASFDQVRKVTSFNHFCPSGVQICSWRSPAALGNGQVFFRCRDNILPSAISCDPFKSFTKQTCTKLSNLAKIFFFTSQGGTGPNTLKLTRYAEHNPVL